MRKKLLTALVVLPAALTLAACGGSSSKGHGSTASSKSPGAGSVAGVTSGPVLAGLLEVGVHDVTSAHITLTESALGQKLNGTGDETLSGGKVTAQQLHQTVPTIGDVQLVIAGGKTYAKLPAPVSGKPWVAVTPNSTNPTVTVINSLVASIQVATALSSIPALPLAATSVKAAGTTAINGAQTQHYKLTVDPKKLPSAGAAGTPTAPFPADLWIDSSKRPVQLSLTVVAAGQSIPTVITFSDFNKPVTITAPPADQVATG